MITAEVVDAQGRQVPLADHPLTFKINGSGPPDWDWATAIPAATNPTSPTAAAPLNGLCMAIVQATKTAGEIRIQADSPGLASGTVTVTAAPATPRPAL